MQLGWLVVAVSPEEKDEGATHVEVSENAELLAHSVSPKGAGTTEQDGMTALNAVQ